MDDAEQFRTVLDCYGSKLGKPGRKLLAFLRESGLSPAAVELVAGYNLKPSECYDGVSSIVFYDEDNVIQMNHDGGMPIGLRDGLLFVGRCVNGDQVTVDVRDRLGEAGYVTCGEMWHVGDVRDVFVVLAPGLGALVAALHAGGMPEDYCAAVDWVRDRGA